ncbi:MAG: hypothetical protein IJI67_07665 [Clostridia bacterium]|nr:hypothetical protein [Clostridia bacterium]
MIELYKTNRTFRTFVQSFVASVIANAAAAVTMINSENWWKILLNTLIIPAMASAFAEITSESYEGE